MGGDWWNDGCIVAIILLTGVFPDSRLRGNDERGSVKVLRHRGIDVVGIHIIRNRLLIIFGPVFSDDFSGVGSGHGEVAVLGAAGKPFPEEGTRDGGFIFDRLECAVEAAGLYFGSARATLLVIPRLIGGFGGLVVSEFGEGDGAVCFFGEFV